nr:unnamed protein product [Callosobruchus analis]
MPCKFSVCCCWRTSKTSSCDEKDDFKEDKQEVKDAKKVEEIKEKQKPSDDNKDNEQQNDGENDVDSEELSDLSDCDDTSEDDCEDFIEPDEYDIDDPAFDRNVAVLVFENDLERSCSNKGLSATEASLMAKNGKFCPSRSCEVSANDVNMVLPSCDSVVHKIHNGLTPESMPPPTQRLNLKKKRRRFSAIKKRNSARVAFKKIS